MEWIEGLSAALQPQPLLLLMLGIVIGMPVGAIPGLTATMTVAILLPVTFFFDPLPGIMMLLGIYLSVLFSSAIPAILINTPGTPCAAATVLDGYPMMVNGRGGQALATSSISSGIAGIIGGLMLAFFAPAVAEITRLFNAPVYFALAVLGLIMVVSIAEDNLVKGLISGLLGVMISMVGLDPVGGSPRFTFGFDPLLGGLSIIPLLIGLFGMSEALRNYENIRTSTYAQSRIGKFMLTKSEWRQIMPTTIGSSIIGFFVGVLPGVGGDIGGFVAYNETKRFAKVKSMFGKGDIRGVAAAEAANNSSSAGALVPMMTLGIPGDTVTAILIGAITVHGLRPGPRLFEGSPDLVYGIFVAMILGAAIVLVLGLLGIRVWAQILKARPPVFWPVVFVLCVLGSFAFRASFLDVVVMLCAGVLGYFMTKGRYPLAPVVIGMILGPLMEESLGRAVVISGGSLAWVFDPLPLSLLILAVLSIVYSIVRGIRAKGKKPLLVPTVEEIRQNMDQESR